MLTVSGAVARSRGRCEAAVRLSPAFRQPPLPHPRARGHAPPRHPASPVGETQTPNGEEFAGCAWRELRRKPAAGDRRGADGRDGSPEPQASEAADSPGAQKRLLGAPRSACSSVFSGRFRSGRGGGAGAEGTPAPFAPCEPTARILRHAGQGALCGSGCSAGPSGAGRPSRGSHGHQTGGPRFPPDGFDGGQH